jgi:uncharacterized protein
VNPRRHFAFLEHSIDHGIQWAVFESNGSARWETSLTVRGVLVSESGCGQLLGFTPKEAYASPSTARR